ncbi:MAG: septal ring lytic transglycosylase RlpA family protein [Treponema sp.]
MNKKLCIVAVLLVYSFNFLVLADNIISADVFASYYGEPFHGRPTSSGEPFDMNAYTAAHRTLPFGTMVEVTNLENGKKVIVRINDRGPFVGNREIDLSRAAAEALGMIGQGIARVSIKRVGQQEVSLETNKDSSWKAIDSQAGSENTATETANTSNNDVIKDAYQAQRSMVYVPTTPEQTKGVLWRIQVGSFAREENALQLVIKLREIGFEPAYEKIETHVRVVLYGIRPTDLEKVKAVLDNNNYRGYVIRQESW